MRGEMGGPGWLVGFCTLVLVFDEAVVAMNHYAGGQESCNSDTGGGPRMTRPTEMLVADMGWKGVAVVGETKEEALGYHTAYFMQPIDHFNFSGSLPPTAKTGNNSRPSHFRMRFLHNLSRWGGKGSPLLFYTGNEGPITSFWDNSGFLVDVLSKELKAGLVFAEGRYFGESQPFGDVKTSLLPGNANFLTVEQTMEDYANFMLYMLTYIRRHGTLNFTSAVVHPYSNLSFPHRYDDTTPIIAVGGSFGGMLSAWMRMKYPEFVTAALAGSAPVRGYLNLTNQFAYFHRVTTVFSESLPSPQGPLCVNKIRRGFQSLAAAEEDVEAQWADVKEGFGICDGAENSCGGKVAVVRGLVNWLTDAFSNMSMVNYPYPTNFVLNVPAWPVRAMCQEMTKERRAGMTVEVQRERGTSDKTNRLGSLRESRVKQEDHVIDIWKCMRSGMDKLGVLQPAACLNPTVPSDELGDQGWNFLACTTQVLPTTTNGITDMFSRAPFDQKAYNKSCQSTFKVT
eukprot:GHVS01059905.1.p1 GENE.GHVS01059905.1~~GHVS01059905.1.p1  ORF type:complete len:511 (+),score=79.50 GHVS01059905.1:76-1608(+)